MRSKKSGNPSLNTVVIRCIFFFLSCLISTYTYSEIFKTTLPDGRIIYSDQAGEQAERINLPPTNQLPAPKMPKTQSKGAPKKGDKSKQAPNYTHLKITQPSNDTLIPGLDGKVSVVVSIQPALGENHKLALYLNGKQHKQGNETSFTLNGLAPGTHTIKAVVKNETGKTLKASKVSKFHIRRTPPNTKRRGGNR